MHESPICIPDSIFYIENYFWRGPARERTNIFIYYRLQKAIQS